ncbi:MAG TPA: hypothetical protein DEB39_03875 [Planctomycetaceae bacterium]|nr:hypothetical protein [Planctomycetaceae bacterium]
MEKHGEILFLPFDNLPIIDYLYWEVVFHDSFMPKSVGARASSMYPSNGPKMLPRTIVCRSNATCNLLFTVTLWRVSAASRLDQMSVFIAFPVYRPDELREVSALLSISTPIL